MKKLCIIAIGLSFGALYGILGDIVRDTGNFASGVVGDTFDATADIVDDITYPVHEAYYDRPHFINRHPRTVVVEEEEEEY